jgi:hypothetical protein
MHYSSFSADSIVTGQARTREMSGLGDPRFHFSINLLGGSRPYSEGVLRYQQNLIVGVSVPVSAPLGQYDNDKLLNLGNNRW